MENDIIAILSEKNAFFSKRQHAVADYICEHPDRAAFMTAEMLAIAAGVSESTVVRFALELGFEGYPDMRRSVQELLRRRFSPAGRESPEPTEAEYDRLFKKTLGEYSEAITALSEGKNPENFDRAVKILHNAKRVFILSSEGGQDAARYLWRGVNLLRDGAVLVRGDVYEQLCHIGTGDAVVCLYLASSYRERFGAARYAHENGAAVIAICDREAEPNLISADSLILCGGKGDIGPESVISAYAVAGALLGSLGSAEGQELKEALKKIEKTRQEYEENERR